MEKSIKIAQYGGVGGGGTAPYSPGGSPIGKGGYNPGGWDVNSFTEDISFEHFLARTHNPPDPSEERNIENRLEIFHRFSEDDVAPFTLTPRERYKKKVKEEIEKHEKFLQDASNRLKNNSVNFIKEHYKPQNEHVTGIEQLLSSRRKYEEGFKSDLIDNIPDLIKPERIHWAIRDLDKIVQAYPINRRDRVTEDDSEDQSEFETYRKTHFPNPVPLLGPTDLSLDEYLEVLPKQNRSGYSEFWNTPALPFDVPGESPFRNHIEKDKSKIQKKELNPNLSLDANLHQEPYTNYHNYLKSDDSTEKLTPMHDLVTDPFFTPGW
jgi:hypothetical protein